jgi:MinD-like ATPase involved in chromosome partitioning or flagellar assembly
MSSDLSRPGTPVPGPTDTRFLVVCSGIDGVGKSSLSINLAIALASGGKRVCVLDTDSGIGNVHHQLGISADYTLLNVARQDCNLRDAMRSGPGGINLLHDGGYHAQVDSLPDAQHRQLLQQLRNRGQDFDLVLIDSTASNAPEPWLAIADSLLIVLAPQSHCLGESFALLSHLELSAREKPMHVVVNRSKGPGQAKQIFEKFSSAVRKYLGIDLHYCGHIAYDDNIRNSAALQYPVALYDKEDPSCKGFFDLAAVLEAQWKLTAPGLGGLVKLAGRQKPHQTVAPPSWPERSSGHWELGDKERFLQTPALADELIDQGLLTPQELRQVIEDLLATGHHEFPATFPGSRKQRPTQAAGASNSQPSLLEKLRQSSQAGLSLDQVLYEYVREK